MSRRIILTASLLGAIAVMFGAFGAHGLKKVVDAADLEIWAKGVEYQFYHAFALLFLSQWKTEETKLQRLAYWFFTIGTVFFSGSLYLLSTTELLGISTGFIGPVTPIGGLLFILGWLSVFLAAVRSK
ncbi:DUF423 domain-containing protein [Pedobacter sp. GR22-6]|uniref:DUF423 domain-containing protein n=1 Tax=Pedobacter sp. GR22-6 TaxID=3127957 RepID=UPI00307F065C